jgi:hypothetical protein
MFLSCFILGVFGYDENEPKKCKESVNKHVQQATLVASNVTGQEKSNCKIINLPKTDNTII